MSDLHHEVIGSGPAVCLVHSGVTDSRSWDRQVETLEPHYTVVRCDLRGYGDSPLAEGPVSNVDDLRELLDALEIERTALVGNSFGGRVALELAVDHPERVTKLVLVAAALRDHDWSEEMRRFGEAEDAAIERGDLEAAVELNLETWVQPHVRELVRPMQQRALEVQVAAYESKDPPGPERALDPPASSRLGELRMPTLVLVGDRTCGISVISRSASRARFPAGDRGRRAPAEPRASRRVRPLATAVPPERRLKGAARPPSPSRRSRDP